MMSDWIYAAQDSGISEYNKCSNTLINWQTGILNTFEYPYSNGFTDIFVSKIEKYRQQKRGSIT